MRFRRANDFLVTRICVLFSLDHFCGLIGPFSAAMICTTFSTKYGQFRPFGIFRVQSTLLRLPSPVTLTEHGVDENLKRQSHFVELLLMDTEGRRSASKLQSRISEY